MSSRESALGAWADKIPRVDGWTEPRNWNSVAEESPLSVDDVERELKQCGLLLLLGIAPLLVAGGLMLSDLDVIMHGQATSGTIVDLRPGPKGYFPVAEFYVNGERHVAMGRTSTRRPIHEIGDTVPIRYVPDDPDQAIIDSFFQHFLFPTILAVVGLTFVLIAAASGVHILRKASANCCA